MSEPRNLGGSATNDSLAEALGHLKAQPSFSSLDVTPHCDSDDLGNLVDIVKPCMNVLFRNVS